MSLNALLGLTQMLFADEQPQQNPQGNPQYQQVDPTEQKLQESKARNENVAPLGNTYIDDRIAEQNAVEEFNKEKLNLIGAMPTNSPDHNQASMTDQVDQTKK